MPRDVWWGKVNYDNIAPYVGETFGIDAREVQALVQLISVYGDTARDIINDVLHGEGAQEIKKEITPLIPMSPSNKTWSGKKAHARSMMPRSFKQDNGNLYVNIVARGTYGYLYFPDDGSNTINHMGNKQFMLHGAENAQDAIIEKVTSKLTDF